MKIGILFGGKSAEHEVSCISANSIYSNIDREKYEVYLIGITKEGKFRHFTGSPDMMLDCTWESAVSENRVDILGNDNPAGIYGPEMSVELDCIFPVLHGPYGEDGRLQGILDYSGIPYVGCGMMSSALCMDKIYTKQLLNAAGVRQSRYSVVRKNHDMKSVKDDLEGFSYPLFVKPANMGSSVGITKVKNESELESAIEVALRYDSKVLVEEGVDAREIEVSVLGNDDEISVSTPGEIIVNDDFYDYETKYIKSTSTLQIPAEITEAQSKEIRSTAEAAYRALGCRGLSRVDFFIDKKDGSIILNEINTMPGFTKISMYPKLMAYDGIPYKELITRLIELSFRDRQ